MCNEHTVGCGAAEAVGQIQQSLGQAAGNIGEDQISQGLVSVAQATSQGLDNLVGNRGVELLGTFEGLVLNSCQAGLGNSHRVGRTGRRIEESHLAEHIAGAHDGDHVLAAIGGGATQLHLAGEHGKELIVLVTLVEEDGVTGEVNLLNVIGQQGKCCVVKIRKKRGATEDLEIHEVLLDMR